MIHPVVSRKRIEFLIKTNGSIQIKNKISKEERKGKNSDKHNLLISVV